MDFKNLIITETLVINNHKALGITYKIEEFDEFNLKDLMTSLTNKSIIIHIGGNSINSTITSTDAYFSNTDNAILNIFFATSLPSESEVPIGSKLTVL